jgi:hypothetical protein|tara:strand:+ start:28 stop:729 length:702 start_codon:yes stop_codon:yes gene_type:complete
MGNRRMSLGRMEALLEQVDRDLNLANSTLTNCTITTSAAATFTGGLTANDITSNYVRFVTGDYSGLTVSTKSDANSRGGLTYAVNTVTENAVDGGTGASAITLPAATLGALVVHRFTAQADGGQNIVFSCAGGEFFAAQTLNTDVSNLGDLVPGRRVLGTDFTQTVATYGGAIVTVAGTHNTLTIAMTATNNQTNIGAEVAFYCAAAGTWRLMFQSSELGSGALNATFATTAV